MAIRPLRLAELLDLQRELRMSSHDAVCSVIPLHYHIPIGECHPVRFLVRLEGILSTSKGLHSGGGDRRTGQS